MEPLFVSEDLKKDIKQIQRKSVHGKATGVYFIVLKQTGSDVMEILPSRLLLTKYNKKFVKKEQFLVIGMAGNKRSAIELVGEIYKHIIKETEGFDVRGYYRSRNGG
jgi:hypothetical protein